MHSIEAWAHNQSVTAWVARVGARECGVNTCVLSLPCLRVDAAMQEGNVEVQSKTWFKVIESKQRARARRV